MKGQIRSIHRGRERKHNVRNNSRIAKELQGGMMPIDRERNEREKCVEMRIDEEGDSVGRTRSHVRVC